MAVSSPSSFRFLKRGERVLDEYLATVCSLQDEQIKQIDTDLLRVNMADAFFQ